ncbi:hypothetical protein SDRG_06697 [Saprolegnia diclina VS20]|uniref:DRBM domain-containing protein n=1 Tax=Saprolegnia diclina (strain VS20) TaxID=1156394 RepID=T0QDM3_SAPDV|nr:hypothetical protein SDRG_06697 [Saprolegnia diclina VS20]EQC35954.1 hypothetical protein SDRG_06697 [Saprolegnia diclina VS20]|eukprot:XP_008610716.1 hypothetical protein SDRG_06697 [Saprolegnia diclina VS20]
MTKRPLDVQATEDSTFVESTTYTDKALPEGWKKVSHRSGLTCFLHEASGVVTWTEPYVVELSDAASVSTAAATHVPPLDIFASGCGMRHPDRNRPVKMVQADAIIRRLSKTVLGDREPTVTPNPAPAPKPTEQPSLDPRKRLKANHQNGASTPSPPRRPTKQEAKSGRPKIVLNGVTVDEPTGKTAMAFLLDYAKNWVDAIPEYEQTNSTSSDAPFRCSVAIGGREYGLADASSKQLARQKAAEAALETLVPGYWRTLKSGGATHEVDTMAAELSAAPTFTLDRFQPLLIDDRLVLQGCMDLSVKTPAQLLSEYATRHKGIAINYTHFNVPFATDRNKFKVVASTGKHSAEAVAPNKKLAKQYAAQALLKVLHPQIGTYYDMVQHHERVVLKTSSAHKPKPVVLPTSTALLGTPPTQPATSILPSPSTTSRFQPRPSAPPRADPYRSNAPSSASMASSQQHNHGNNHMNDRRPPPVAVASRYGQRDYGSKSETSPHQGGPSAPKPHYAPPSMSGYGVSPSSSSSYRGYHGDTKAHEGNGGYQAPKQRGGYGDIKREPVEDKKREPIFGDAPPYYAEAPRDGYGRPAPFGYRPSPPPAQWQQTASYAPQSAYAAQSAYPPTSGGLLPPPPTRLTPSANYGKASPNNPLQQLKSELRKSLQY